MRPEKDLLALMDRLGHKFTDPSLLSLALTHPSSGAREDNQRLEFLGDAVLELCVSDALYALHPDMQEGDLTQTRAALVREESLAKAARALAIGPLLALDHGEAHSGGRDKPSVLADAMEAVLGAVYLDGGLSAAKALCGRMLGDFTPTAAQPNWKSLLQEREQAQGRPAPEYRVASEDGPPHARVFTVEAVLAGGRRAEGRGPSKKQAEQEAARLLMEAKELP